MPTTKQRSQHGSKRQASTSTVVPKPIVDQAHHSLAELVKKPKENAPLNQAVDHVVDVITGALAQGYSYEKLTEVMQKNGFSINVERFKQASTSSEAKATQKTADSGRTSAGRGGRTKTNTRTTKGNAPAQPSRSVAKSKPTARTTSARSRVK